jgi:hypothetical protein
MPSLAPRLAALVGAAISEGVDCVPSQQQQRQQQQNQQRHNHARRALKPPVERTPTMRQRALLLVQQQQHQQEGESTQEQHITQILLSLVARSPCDMAESEASVSTPAVATSLLVSAT